jgi:hypothetical protein
MLKADKEAKSGVNSKKASEHKLNEEGHGYFEGY